MDKERVAIVVDPNYGSQLDRIAVRHPVWIVDTLMNRDAVEKQWADGRDVTTFKVESPDDRLQNFLGVVDVVDLHHGASSQAPPYRSLLIIGVREHDLAERLSEAGFVNGRGAAEGFIVDIGPDRESIAES
jgi:hypothetical protein